MPVRTLLESNPQHGLSINPAVLEKKPHLAMLVARVIATWASVESLLGVVLCDAMGGDRIAVAAMFQATNASSRAKAAIAGIRIALEQEEDRLVLDIVYAKYKICANTRHRYSHYLYGECESFPDSLILTHPQYHVNLLANEDHLFVRKNSYVYYKDDILEEVFAMTRQIWYFQHFLAFFRQEDLNAVRRLASVPEIAAGLGKIRR